MTIRPFAKVVTLRFNEAEDLVNSNEGPAELHKAFSNAIAAISDYPGGDCLIVVAIESKPS